MITLYVGGLFRETLLSSQQIKINLYVGGLYREVLRNQNTLPTWTTSSGALRVGSSGAQYSITLQGNTTTGQKIFALVSGNLPPGVVISATGNIYGIPGAVNQNTTYSFVVSLSDGINTITQSNSIQINPNGAVVWQTPAGVLPAATGGEAYSAPVVASSSNPVTYQLKSGALPPGLSINSNQSVIAGTPTRSSLNKVYNFTLSALA